MKKIAPVVLHPYVAYFVSKLSRDALRLLIKIGEEVYKANNSTIPSQRVRGEHEAHVLIQREVLCASCGISERQWERAVKQLDKYDLLYMAPRNSLGLDRYFIIRPSVNKVNRILIKTRRDIPRTFRRKKT